MTAKLKVGIIGLNFGKHIIDAMIRSGSGSEFFELGAVCATTQSKVDKFAEAYGCKGYVGMDALLADDDIPVIILMTGPIGRAEQIRKIIRAGKDVMTTKPFEIDSAEAESVLKEARELDRIVYLNSPCAAASGDLSIIRDWVKKYDLGRPVAGHHECWYKSVEKADGSWYDDPELCPVAPIFRLGIYGLNDLMQIFGEPDCLQVMESRIFTGRPTPDLARMTIKFRDGCLVDLINGWVPQPGRDNSLILYYENGTIFRNPTGLPNKRDSGETILCVVSKDSENGLPDEQVVLKEAQLSFRYQWDVFHKAVTTRVRPVDETPDSVIINAIKVTEAMKRAMHSGATEKI